MSNYDVILHTLTYWIFSMLPKSWFPHIDFKIF